MRTRHIVTLLLLALVIVSGWLLQKPRDNKTPDTAGVRGPDMYARQIEVTVLDESGLPGWRITAEQIEHSPETESFQLVNPFIAAADSAGDSWEITSDRGQMNDAGDRLWLQGEVKILREGIRSMQVETRDILVKPEDESAETDNEVRISTPGYVIHAIGFKADFRNRLVELRSRVRGTIDVSG